MQTTIQKCFCDQNCDFSDFEPVRTSTPYTRNSSNYPILKEPTSSELENKLKKLLLYRGVDIVIPEIIILLESQITTPPPTDDEEDSSSSESTETVDSDQDLDPRIDCECGGALTQPRPQRRARSIDWGQEENGTGIPPQLTDDDSSSSEFTDTIKSDQDLDPIINSECGDALAQPRSSSLSTQRRYLTAKSIDWGQDEKNTICSPGTLPSTDHALEYPQRNNSRSNRRRHKYQRTQSTPLNLIDFTTHNKKRSYRQSRAQWQSTSRRRITKSNWQRSSFDLDPELDADSKKACNDINFMAKEMRKTRSRPGYSQIKCTSRDTSYTNNLRLSASRSLSITRSLSSPHQSLSNISTKNSLSNIQYDRTLLQQYLVDNKITFDAFFSTLITQFCHLHHRSLLTILYSTKYDLFLDLLCTSAFDINTDDGYVSPLLLAVEQENLELVELLLSFENIDINIQKPSNHWTPLIIASNLNNLLIVRALLSHADINLHQADIIGYNAFIYALKSQHQPELPGNTSLSNYINDDGITDESSSSMELSHNVVEAFEPEKVTKTSNALLLLLFEHMDATLPHHVSTIVNYCDDCDISLLTHAVLENNIEIVELLLQYPQIDISSVCSLHRTPLMCACDEKNPDMVTLLLQSFPNDIDCQDIFGWTALMFASQNNDVETVEMLVHAYPYILSDLKNHDGCTASSLTSNARIKALLSLS